MEIAGTALGVVALAGLFNTCLETLDILHSAATYGVRRERLAIKIEVEKIRLMIWGESVGISDLGDNPDEDDLEDVDDGLKRPRLRSAIMGLLVSFATILEDVESLGKEYGLAPDPSSGQTAHQLASAPDTLSSTFRKTYARFKSSSAAHQNAPGKTKARWAILDEKKFLVLVAELKAINDSLNSLLPTVQQKVRMQMRQEIMQSNSIEQLESLVTAADDVQDLLAETASLRLEMLTLNGGRRHESKVVQVEPEGSSLPTSTPAPNVPRPISMSIQRKPAPIQRPMSIQPGPASPSPAKPVVAAPPKPPYDDTGALLLHKIFMDKSLSIFSWLSGLDKSSESNPTPPLHPGFGKSLPFPTSLRGPYNPPLSCNLRKDPYPTGSFPLLRLQSQSAQGARFGSRVSQYFTAATGYWLQRVTARRPWGRRGVDVTCSRGTPRGGVGRPVLFLLLGDRSVFGKAQLT